LIFVAAGLINIKRSRRDGERGIMRQDDLTELRNLELFRGMNEDVFTALARAAYVQTFPPQVQLFSEGDRADFLHVLLSGRVELFASWNCRETTMATLQGVSTFILAACVLDRPYLMSARTLEKSKVALIPCEDVRAACDQDGAFVRAITLELATDYRDAIKATKDLKLRSANERLANFLLRLHDEMGPCFELPVEKRRVASILGMTPESFSRSLNTLAKYGVTVDGAAVTLADPDDLAKLAKPAYLIDDAGS
jgi:CRP/FNR family transcriptional activator FtrB